MLRWLVRLLVLAVIAIVGVIVVSRLTNREEDFEDYDDLEAGFDFHETPVEIEVPAEQSAGGSSAGSGGGSNGMGGASMETTQLGEGGGQLIDINGIGPAFDARLKAIGINSPADLAQADANSLSEQLDVIGGLATIEDWIAQARTLSTQSASGGQGQ
ncbi:MAG TPA: helix-hairpin-helix domain-containing protein [Chloroflexia bacterium]|nr:helix-hairpin-helix domain-containing protein [Chloroflexia bacterium]